MGKTFCMDYSHGPRGMQTCDYCDRCPRCQQVGRLVNVPAAYGYGPLYQLCRDCNIINGAYLRRLHPPLDWAMSQGLVLQPELPKPERGDNIAFHALLNLDLNGLKLWKPKQEILLRH